MNLAPFVEWGGPVWAKQVRDGLDWLGDVNGLRLLEIGPRYGGMATLFALNGARVTALDISSEAFDVARNMSERHGVGSRVSYEVYSGNPRDLPTGYDVVFSKSTLVMMPNIDAAVEGVAASLIDGGRLLAVENARGSWAVQLARLVRRRSRRPYGATYFDRRSIASVSSKLRIELEQWTSAPPTVLLGAVKVSAMIGPSKPKPESDRVGPYLRTRTSPQARSDR